MPEGVKIPLRIIVKTEDNTEAWLRTLKARVNDWVKETALLIVEYAKEDAPAGATGELAASIEAVVEEFTGGVLKATIGTSCGYGLYAEKGREPGHFPPSAPLEYWAKRVLGKDHLGWVIARAIAERGIEPQPFLYPAYERALNEMLPRLKAMLH